MRGGTCSDFEIFWALGVAELMVFGGNMGVLLMDGRLKAAGSMSGMVRDAD
jgi:hypothetical protein